MLMPAPSVSELAAITGLAIDPTWEHAGVSHATGRTGVWCAPGLHPERLLETAPSNLPSGSAVRVETRCTPIRWDAEMPVSVDLHWLREITPGMPLGVRPVRVWLERPARVGVQLAGGFSAVLWRDAHERMLASVAPWEGARWNADVEVRRCETQGELEPCGELPRALTGASSIEWLRGVFADSCSRRWNELAVRLGVRADELDDLGTHFRSLRTTEEDALWRASASLDALQSLRPWVSLLEAGQTTAFRDLLREELDWGGAAFWRSAAGEWLSAIAAQSGLVHGGLELSEDDVARMREPARRVSSLLIRAGLAELLVRLHAEAEREWTQLAPWYRRRLEESCGALSAGVCHATLGHEISLWIRKLHRRLCGQAGELALAAARSQLAAVAASGEGGKRARFAFDLTPQGDLAAERVLTGDWRPCFESARGLSASGLRWTGGAWRDALALRRPVEVQLPYLDRAAWKSERESLAGAPARAAERGLTLYAPGSGAFQHAAELLLGGVCTARAEAPSDNLVHFSVEHCHGSRGDASDAPWQRLAAAYGLAAPASSGDVTLRLEIPRHWADEWCNIPVKREAGYVEKFLQLSLTLQEMTRHWLPALFIRSAEMFDAPNTVLPLLVYAASQPHSNRKQGEFTYDTMNPAMVQKAAASALERLPGILAPISAKLREAGRTKAAEMYSPSRARLIISAVQRKPREFARLLAGDGFLLEFGFQVAGMCREVRANWSRNPTRALRKVKQFSEELVKCFQKGLRQYYPDGAYRELGVVYLLEATRVLAGGSPSNGLRATLTLDGGDVARREEAAA